MVQERLEEVDEELSPVAVAADESGRESTTASCTVQAQEGGEQEEMRRGKDR